jgi:hypothetical protein
MLATLEQHTPYVIMVGMPLSLELRAIRGYNVFDAPRDEVVTSAINPKLVPATEWTTLLVFSNARDV